MGGKIGENEKYVPRRIRDLATSFKKRRDAAESNLTRRLDRLDVQIYQQLQEEDTAFGIPADAGRNIFRNADDMNTTINGPGGFTAMKFRYWTRKELWNRLRWLRGQLTKLITGQAHRPHQHKTAHPRRDMTREELIEWRRTQIQRYLQALEQHAPMHAEITRQKRNDRKRKGRAIAKEELRAKELAAALGRPLRPKQKRIRISLSAYLLQSPSEDEDHTCATK